MSGRSSPQPPDSSGIKASIGAHSAVEARYQFGETNVQGRISRCGDELTRTALYEAANLLLIRSTKWFRVERSRLENSAPSDRHSILHPRTRIISYQGSPFQNSSDSVDSTRYDRFL